MHLTNLSTLMLKNRLMNRISGRLCNRYQSLSHCPHVKKMLKGVIQNIISEFEI